MRRQRGLALLLVLGLLPGAQAQESTDPPADPLLNLHADFVWGANPRATSSLFGVFKRWTYGRDAENPLFDGLYFQVGATLEPNPAWTQAAVYVEWSPLAIVQLRLRYDVYSFYGQNEALISFNRKDKYTDRIRERLPDQWGIGHRIIFQPVLRFKWERLILRNSSELAGYFLPGDGPFLLELEFDTLIEEDHGGLIANRTSALFELWKDGDATFLLGVQYELVHAFKSRRNRQRLGLVAYFVPVETLGPLDRPRIFVWTGWNIQDRNRDGEFFVVAGLGFDLDVL